jgi:TrmH family RNA methyltransferase
MPSNADLKIFAALRMPKYRQKYGQFVVEGRKNVSELFHSSIQIVNILATSAALAKYKPEFDVQVISERDYNKISQMDTPPGILAIAQIPHPADWKTASKAKLSLALDGISDPGNLGTIVRTADWFGIRNILLSEDCSDFYGHKCISASMGAFTRVNIFRGNLLHMMAENKAYGCYMQGTPVSEVNFEPPAVIVVGSESHGIRPETETILREKICIPAFGKGESLNAGVAAGIVMYEASKKLLT